MKKAYSKPNRNYKVLVIVIFLSAMTMVQLYAQNNATEKRRLIGKSPLFSSTEIQKSEETTYKRSPVKLRRDSEKRMRVFQINS